MVKSSLSVVKRRDLSVTSVIVNGSVRNIICDKNNNAISKFRIRKKDRLFGMYKINIPTAHTRHINYFIDSKIIHIGTDNLKYKIKKSILLFYMDDCDYLHVSYKGLLIMSE
jgi:hypothetical protein